MISYTKLQETVFDFAYGAALNDAIGQKAFEGNKIPLRKNENAKDIAKQYIDAILKEEKPDFYETAEALEKSFKDHIEKNKESIIYNKQDGSQSNPVFRFGNAQKLINMLAKNMFLLVYQNEALRGRFAQCHCPMDIKMIDHISKKLKETDDEKGKELFKKYKKSGNLAWSRIDGKRPKQYEAFQACIKHLADQEGLSPIEYDYWYWKNTQQTGEAE